MAARLSDWLAANGTHSHYGCQWGELNGSIRLQVWYVDGQNAALADVETVEAEADLECRQRSAT